MENPLKLQLKQLIIDKLGLEDITPADIGDNTALFADDGLAQTLRDHFYSVDTLAAWIEHKQQESP